MDISTGSTSVRELSWSSEPCNEIQRRDPFGFPPCVLLSISTRRTTEVLISHDGRLRAGRI
jgi:hypothetical protein